jgi:hypothetical protein
MALTQTIDSACPTCRSPMGLVRVSPLDRQYDLRFFKCERCKCEVCLHTETVNSRSETAKEQSETGMIRAAIKNPAGMSCQNAPTTGHALRPLQPSLTSISGLGSGDPIPSVRSN